MSARRFVRWLLVACSLGAAGAASAQIVVAQVSPKDGFLGFYTRQLTIGAQAAFSAMNAQGGVNGRQIRFVTSDDRADPARTVALYEELVATQAPVAFLYQVGPAGIERLLATRKLDKLKVPLLGTLPAVDPYRTPVRPFVYHLRRGDEPELALITKQLVTIGLNRAAVLAFDDSAGLNAVPLAKKALERVGGQLVHSAYVKAGQTLSDEGLAALRGSGAQVALLFMPAETAGAVVARLRDAGVGMPIYSVSYLDVNTLVKSAGVKHARGVAISQAVPNPFASNLPIVVQYRQDMAALPAAERGLSPFTLEGYIAARVLIEAVRATGKQAPTGQDVQRALDRMDQDIGGLPVRFQPDMHIGLNIVDLAVVDAAGLLRY